MFMVDSLPLNELNIAFTTFVYAISPTNTNGFYSRAINEFICVYDKYLSVGI